MLNRYTALSAAMLCALGATAAGAQTAPAAPPTPTFPTKAERVADVRYLTIETLTTKPGTRVWTIVNKHFMPAARSAGPPMPLVYHTETGTPRTIVITELSGGTDDLGWSTSADDLKFMQALAKQEGSPEKAMALMKEYTDSIDTRSRELIHQHTK